jgi:phospholipase C
MCNADTAQAVDDRRPNACQFRFVDNSSGILDPYLRLARDYGWANHMFQTNQGPSFPAHQSLFGGTSAPSALDDAEGIFAAENTGFNNAGCAASVDATVLLIDPTGEERQRIYPCFEHHTVADLFASPLTWRYYAPTTQLIHANTIWNAPNVIRHICQSSGPGGTGGGTTWQGNVDLVTADVLNDIANCRLRSVSWVIPTGANADHAGVNDGGRPSWGTAVVNTIGQSTACDGNTGYWKNTAIVITWDDWGGWYDHVPPTILAGPQGDHQYGFRVPLLFVSANTPKGYINDRQLDFGSVLRFTERNFESHKGPCILRTSARSTIWPHSMTSSGNLGPSTPSPLQKMPASC